MSMIGHYWSFAWRNFVSPLGECPGRCHTQSKLFRLFAGEIPSLFYLRSYQEQNFNHMTWDELRKHSMKAVMHCLQIKWSPFHCQRILGSDWIGLDWIGLYWIGSQDSSCDANFSIYLLQVGSRLMKLKCRIQQTIVK
jgi:hypothetical protein